MPSLSFYLKCIHHAYYTYFMITYKLYNVNPKQKFSRTPKSRLKTFDILRFCGYGNQKKLRFCGKNEN